MTMYFPDRTKAGEILAQRLSRYCDDTVTILALTNGAVMVGRPMLAHLGAALTLMVSRDVDIPGESLTIGTIDQSGGFTYNQSMSEGEIEEYVGEFHNQIEADKLNKVAEINRLVDHSGLIERHQLRDQVIVLLSDGARSGTAFQAAASYLKPVRIKRMIAACPVASVPAVDKMHILADEIQVLSVVDNYLDTNHYYDRNDVPDDTRVLELLSPGHPDTGVAKKGGRHYA